MNIPGQTPKGYIPGNLAPAMGSFLKRLMLGRRHFRKDLVTRVSIEDRSAF
jgi:hypothetical protein